MGYKSYKAKLQKLNAVRFTGISFNVIHVYNNTMRWYMDKLDFNKNSLYYLLMDHAGIADETDGQRLRVFRFDQMFDDLLLDQEQPGSVFDSAYFKRGGNEE